MARQRIDLGILHNGRVEMPRLGAPCVCCNGDTQGRTENYDASTDRVSAPPIPMPVCFDCKDHALQHKSAGQLHGAGLVVGVSTAGLGLFYLSERPGGLPLVMIVVGLIIAIVTIVSLAKITKREKRDDLLQGHHPRLTLTLVFGRSWLDTRNGELVDRALALNPKATRVRTPLLWRRREAKELAQARVVKKTSRG